MKMLYERKKYVSHKLKILLILFVLGVLFLYFFLTPPLSFFSEAKSIEITQNESLVEIAAALKENGIIRSEEAFRVLARFLNVDTTISPGIYTFSTPQFLPDVLFTFINSNSNAVSVKITFPEGITNKQMADIVHEKIPTISTDVFIAEAAGKEGYLFPDTYFFSPGASSSDIIKKLQNTFTKKTDPLKMQITESKLSFGEVIILASLVEKEAFGKNDRKIIAGILLNRLDKGMPLQVDAPFLYILGKSSDQLTLSDLAIDSPFNTYLYKGLPPTPINNPGLDTIQAVISPKETPYLYYLHDKKGTVYYAKTFSEHKQNKKLYLK